MKGSGGVFTVPRAHICGRVGMVERADKRCEGVVQRSVIGLVLEEVSHAHTLPGHLFERRDEGIRLARERLHPLIEPESLGRAPSKAEQEALLEL